MTQEIELVAPDPAFAEVFAGWRSEATTLRYNPIKQLAVDELRAQLAACPRLEDGLQENATYRLFVRSEGKLVGNVSLKSVGLMMMTAEIGYGVGEQFQGRGFASFAVAAFVDLLLSRTELRKLTAFVHSENKASCRVLEKAGFTVEGRLREHYLIAGQPVDELAFGLLRREWAQRAV